MALRSISIRILPIALVLAAPGWAQTATPAASDAETIDEWRIEYAEGAQACTASSTSGDSRFAFVWPVDGRQPLVAMSNRGWDAQPGQRYAAAISLDRWDSKQEVIFFGGAAGGAPALNGAMPADAPERFRASSRLNVSVPDLGIEDSYAIEQGERIWGALEGCARRHGPPNETGPAK